MECLHNSSRRGDPEDSFRAHRTFASADAEGYESVIRAGCDSH